jgi:TRAP-type C4-dicarboxylate transport system substrate-binding protein
MHILDFAMVFDDWDHFDRIYHTGGGYKITDDEAREHNMKEVFIMPYGNTLGPITAKKKVVTHQDLKGLKIRSMGGNIALAIQALGSTPVFMSSVKYIKPAEKSIDEQSVGDKHVLSEVHTSRAYFVLRPVAIL